MIYKPCIAIGIGVSQRYCLSTLQRKNKILCIQHVQHRIDTIAIHLCHISWSITDSLEYTIHLRRDISIYQFLIATQLCSMIATNTLQVEAGLIFIKCWWCQVEYTIVKRLILQDMIYGSRLRHWLFTNGLRYKHLIVQIALIYRPHINKTDDQNNTNGIFFL